jgi:hypothetical protein
VEGRDGMAETRQNVSAASEWNLDVSQSKLDLSTPIVRIRPSKGWVSLQLDELWEYRELLYFLIWRRS